MPPPTDPVVGSPQEWLRRARADLALAGVALPEGGVREDLAYHAQQAAEKAVKAVYIALGQPFEYTHNLGRLTSGLAAGGVEVPREVGDCAALTGFASTTRYPNLSEPLTEAELRQAIETAKAVVRWAESRIAP